MPPAVHASLHGISTAMVAISGSSRDPHLILTSDCLGSHPLKMGSQCSAPASRESGFELHTGGGLP